MSRHTKEQVEQPTAKRPINRAGFRDDPHGETIRQEILNTSGEYVDGCHEKCGPLHGWMGDFSREREVVRKSQTKRLEETPTITDEECLFTGPSVN